MTSGWLCMCVCVFIAPSLRRTLVGLESGLSVVFRGGDKAVFWAAQERPQWVALVSAQTLNVSFSSHLETQ